MRRRWLDDDLFHYFAVDQQRALLGGHPILIEDRDRRWWRQMRSNSVRTPWIHIHYVVRR